MTDIQNKTYSSRAKCPNCKDEKIIQIPFGIPMSTYEPNIKCDNCGCNCILLSLKEQWW